MPTVFTAVQCCQCSTMQVKQQKKSSNKWTCVVCNQKQSVRKVFAQGFMAKDVRKFVQSFNMSRQSAEKQFDYEQTLAAQPSKAIVVQSPSSFRKKRTDWTEYINPEEEGDLNVETQETEDVFEPKVVTELPKALFKKPKLKDYSEAPESGDGENSFVPIFTKRKTKTNKQIIFQRQDEEPSECPAKKARGNPKWSDLTTQAEDVFARRELTTEARANKWSSSYMINDNSADRMPWRHRSTTAAANGVSKWKDYVAEDDDGLQLGSGRYFQDHGG